MNKTIYECPSYLEEINLLSKETIFKKFENKTILLTGGTGLILSYFIDTILSSDIKCILFVVVRDYKAAFARFSKFVGDPRLHFIEKSLSSLDTLDKMEVDYVISGASKTNPVNISLSPTSVFLENITGVKNLVKIALNFNKTRFLLLSTTKIYGQNKEVNESSLSLINPNTCDDILGFSKLASEKLVLSYVKEENLDASIARLSRTFGPTLKYDDSKDFSTYIFEALTGDTIFLKTTGEEVIPFSYVGNVVLALTYILINGEKGKAYNLFPKTTYKMKELATLISTYENKELVFSEDVKSVKSQFYDFETSKDLENLGYKPKFDILSSLKTTYFILKEIF